MKRKTINRSNARQVIRLLDYCFKMGVWEASQLEDDYTVSAWLEEHKPVWGYGSLSEPDVPYDWRHWRFILFRWCRMAGLSMLGETYIDMIRKKQSYTYAIIPLSMRFYIRGVEEWLAYPNPLKLELFLQNIHTHWKPMRPSSLQKMNVNDYISDMQMYAYEFQRLPEEVRENIGKASQFDGFIQVIWQFTRSIKTYGEIREKVEATKDL